MIDELHTTVSPDRRRANPLHWLGPLVACLALTACEGGGDDAADPAPDSAASATGADAGAGPSDAIALAAAAAAAEAAAAAAAAALAAEAAAAGQAEQPTTGATGNPGGAAGSTPTSATAGTAALVVRARGTPAGGVPPQMVVRMNGNPIGSANVSATQFTDYSFALSALPAGSRVDVVFVNDAEINGEQRDLHVAYLAFGSQAVMPTPGNSVIDRGSENLAFDGLDTVPGQGGIYLNGALRITWPNSSGADANLARKRDAVRFLVQASFGPTLNDINALVAKPYSTWIDEQMALPYQPDFVNAVQWQYNKGNAWRPNGANYTPSWVGQTFWKTAATSPDQLRKRVAFALHQILMVSQADSSLWGHARAYAGYVDLLNRHAFGNFRDLLQGVALSPAMGIYLSHMRNRKEDAGAGRLPDENFAREVMQLFTIGLYELNSDGSLKRDAGGNPIETYTNDDVMAMAKVFTGWSWAFADPELTDTKFRWGSPDYGAAGDQQIDLRPMKAYPNQHSTAAKTLFAAKPWAISIPANGAAATDLKLALDALFKHPNVGPFIGRQLIQRLVTSQPSPAYVARVAAVFNNNGQGVRGDLGAVVRAILLDAEARGTPPAGFGKLREPVLRVTHWMRALNARSASGDYRMAWDLDSSGQRALQAPSVFSYFRPGYVPPNTSFAASGRTAPEFQVVNEATVAAWVNSAESMAGCGLGWTGSACDVRVDHAALGGLASDGNISNLVDHLDLLLMGGRLSVGLRQSLLDVISSVGTGNATVATDRARAASFLLLASPDYLTQP